VLLPGLSHCPIFFMYGTWDKARATYAPRGTRNGTAWDKWDTLDFSVGYDYEGMSLLSSWKIAVQGVKEACPTVCPMWDKVWDGGLGCKLGGEAITLAEPSARLSPLAFSWVDGQQSGPALFRLTVLSAVGTYCDGG
jgi:hypothetical protein